VEAVVSALKGVALFTNEYPPNVYGGAGGHVEYLSRALARQIPVEVRCFGDQGVQDGNLRVKGYPPYPEAARNTDPRFSSMLDSLARSLAMAKDTLDADLVHCHTWYTDMAGFLAKKLWGIPLVVTIHSLEPLRPWKVEQLGNGYHLSSWMEQTAIEGADAVIAVSRETRNDVLRLFSIAPEKVHVIHNGIDAEQFRKTPAQDALLRHGVDPTRPYVLFVGRITRQKGIIHLVNAIPSLDPSLQVVLCANSPDTKAIGKEMASLIEEISARRSGVVWISDRVSLEELIQFYSHATVFCCPSVYEPFGIINLEAMAAETAVVATAVGGIPEVVIPGETGLLVDPKLKEGSFDPADPAEFAYDLAAAINRVALDPELRQRLVTNGRRWVEHFSWTAIADQTIDLYRSLVDGSTARSDSAVYARAAW
jgi:glycogen synthase